MTRPPGPVDESDLPDYLHNSPFLPIGDDLAYSYPKHIPRPKPTLRQLSNSKPLRVAIITIITLLVILYLWSRFPAAHVLSRLTGPSCYFNEPLSTLQDESELAMPEKIDWSSYAYALYATDAEYLCNALMLFETLKRLESKAERLLLFSNKWSLEEAGSKETRLLLKARDELGVKLEPVDVVHENTAYYYGPNWSDSYTKLLAFDQTQYSRLIVLDSDSSILSGMDELFFLPPAPVIMPRAYWLTKPTLSSHIMVITPSTENFALVRKGLKKAKYGVYDMEIMNSIFGSTCLLLPHRTYALLTGEYRSDNHDTFLNLNLDKGLSRNSEGEDTRGGSKEIWNPDMVIAQASFIHFSDHPLDKPWVASEKNILKVAPLCNKISGWEEECRTRDVWLDLYQDFRARRERVCGSV